MHTLEQLRSGALAGIRRLDLSANLTELPPEVYGLADTLEVLNLSGNRLTQLPHDLPRLHRLKVVFASDNPFTHLPEVLGDCPALEMVGFKACRIAHVPAAALPARLRWLTLTDNAIGQLPAALGERPALQKLMLAGNQLTALPDSLAGAQRLGLLRLSANRLAQLPGWLTDLPELAWLALSGNPLGWPTRAPVSALPAVPWGQLCLGPLLGQGASGHIHQVDGGVDVGAGADAGAGEVAGGGAASGPLALKLFKGAVTSDGLPEHELAACRAAGQHPALCTPSAELAGHPQGLAGLLLPLIPPDWVPLAAPPSLESCTRDVYAPGLHLSAATARHMARQVASAVAHLHRRGVVHGDLYAHNILWQPTTGQAMLSDFGAATLLPTHDPALCQALQALEVRAFGHLLAELAACASPEGDGWRDETPLAGATAGEAVASLAHLPHLVHLRHLARACLVPVGAERPTMADMELALG